MLYKSIALFRYTLSIFLPFAESELISSYGPSSRDRSRLDEWRNAMYIPAAHAPIPKHGYLAGFKFYARRAGTIHMQIWRKTNITLRYKLMYTDEV